MIYLDTSSLIRFFTKDDIKKALKVKNLLEKEKEIYIPEAVFPELEYVLTGVYKAKRLEVMKAFNFLISRSNIKLGMVIKKAVEIFSQTLLDMADCLIISHSLKGKLASFDKKLIKIKGVINYWNE